MTTSGTSDNEWQLLKTSDKDWQRVTTDDPCWIKSRSAEYFPKIQNTLCKNLRVRDKDCIQNLQIFSLTFLSYIHIFGEQTILEPFSNEQTTLTISMKGINSP